MASKMTRINVIPVEELADQHLMAEYRELPMVMSSLRRTLLSKNGWQLDKVPTQYTLNKGHVYFFTNKKQFLRERFCALIQELKFRGYSINPNNRVIDWRVFDTVPQISWKPTPGDIKINAERIYIRISQKPNWYRWTHRNRMLL
jgi:deoxyribonuclease (pyrimidine dimer)